MILNKFTNKLIDMQLITYYHVTFIKRDVSVKNSETPGFY